MKKVLKFLLLGIYVFTLHFVPCTLHASFIDLGCGARPIGMGNAFCAVADDINAFFYNPAGLSQITKVQVSTMYAQLFPGLSDKSNISNNFIAAAYPVGGMGSKSTIGFGWFNLGGASDPDRANASYKENTYLISYAKALESLSLGLSVKFHTIEYGSSYWTDVNPTFSKTLTALGVGLDAGVLFNLDRNLTVGLSLIDINQPALYIATESRIPIIIKAGLGYLFEPTTAFDVIQGALDITYRDNEYKVYAGAEGWLLNRSIGVRGGFGVGTHNFGNIAFGASYQLTEEMYNNDFRIDYGFTYPLNGLQPTGGTHRISLTIGFGPK